MAHAIIRRKTYILRSLRFVHKCVCPLNMQQAEHFLEGKPKLTKKVKKSLVAPSYFNNS